ncbi:Abscisic acid receptor PYR1 [Rhynchospora pubera]|uniref:Abscisic acid receptor PYR1 n=1 Tax=Rhynchospora pubera TaxID=906938 RepID=A0AAV8DHN2_9POAL|nr:Abscisic acid receptor PYR1 [Rhynchospora pubera]
MGGLEVGSVRDISLTTELPATFTTEVLERLDDSECILGIRTNHSSIVTVHPDRIEGRTGTTVVESFVVDLPENNTRDEICYFMEAVIKINLRSLAAVSERLARQQ